MIPSTPLDGSNSLIPSTPFDNIINGDDRVELSGNSPQKRAKTQARSRFESLDPLGGEDDFDDIWGSVNDASRARRTSSVSSASSGAQHVHQSPRAAAEGGEAQSAGVSKDGKISGQAQPSSSTAPKLSSPSQYRPKVVLNPPVSREVPRVVPKLDPNECLKIVCIRNTAGNRTSDSEDSRSGKKRKMRPLIDWDHDSILYPKAI